MQIGVETSRSLENKRIFVVDSDEVIRAALQFILHDENEAHELASLADAFAMRAGRRVDLVLLGAAIARERGAGVFQEIVANIPGTKILLVTDAGAAEFTRDCMRSGSDGILLTPFTVESVRDCVDKILGLRS